MGLTGPDGLARRAQLSCLSHVEQGSRQDGHELARHRILFGLAPPLLEGVARARHQIRLEG